MAPVERISAWIRTSKVICHAKWQSIRYDNPRQRTYAYRMRLSISCGFFVKTLRIGLGCLTTAKGIIFCSELLHLVCVLRCVAVDFASFQLLPLLKHKIAHTRLYNNLSLDNHALSESVLFNNNITRLIQSSSAANAIATFRSVFGSRHVSALWICQSMSIVFNTDSLAKTLCKFSVDLILSMRNAEHLKS